MLKQLSPGEKRFVYYAWIFLAYMLAVILFGAWVRITGSGAGCGSHWPSCHGEIIPIDPSIETIIEYTHRLTSGLLGIFGLILIGWAWKLYGKTSYIVIAAIITYIFILFEGAIGAGLVLAELVADNDSVARAIVIAIHLVNTLILTGASALTAWWAAGNKLPRWHNDKYWKWFLIIGLIGIIATCMTGAVTALGDTLFPVDPTVGTGLFERVRDDLSPANHFLVRLRIAHPIIAIVVAAYLILIGRIVLAKDKREQIRKLAMWVIGAVIVQTLAGFINIGLAAPGWMQLLHLLIAQVVWLTALLLTIATLSHPDSNKLEA